ncbi:MAG: VOC family protein [Candidatus Latescibacterota bacterium]
MSLKHLDHIAFRVDDLNPVVDFYTTTLGFTIVQEMTLDFAGSKAFSKVLNLPGSPFYIFVDQGLAPDNIISRWVKRYGSGLHHMAYLVDDIHAAAELLKKQGMTFTTDRVIDTGGGLKQLFSLPNPVTGILTEIIEREQEGLFFVQENVIQLIKSTEDI